jgi:hypothetical protein
MKYLALAPVVALLGLLPASTAYSCHHPRIIRIVIQHAAHVAHAAHAAQVAHPVYHGCAHTHWQYFAWSAKFGCRCYFCPKARVWYYFHPSQNCYYPLERIREVPPPPVSVPQGAPTNPVPFSRDQLPPPPDAVIPGAPPPVPGT